MLDICWVCSHPLKPLASSPLTRLVDGHALASADPRTRWGPQPSSPLLIQLNPGPSPSGGRLPAVGIRPRLRPVDRFLRVWLARLWAEWQDPRAFGPRRTVLAAPQQRLLVYRRRLHSPGQLSRPLATDPALTSPAPLESPALGEAGADRGLFTARLAPNVHERETARAQGPGPTSRGSRPTTAVVLGR
jgi:hypothetical protein